MRFKLAPRIEGKPIHRKPRAPSAKKQLQQFEREAGRELEREFITGCIQAGLPAPVREFQMSSEAGGNQRRFRWDFAWPDKFLLVEIQGGIWMEKSGHNTGSGIERDMTKLNIATLRGWHTFQFSARMISSGSAVLTVQAFLNRTIHYYDDYNNEAGVTAGVARG